jgi:hypothetical protein
MASRTLGMARGLTVDVAVALGSMASPTLEMARGLTVDVAGSMASPTLGMARGLTVDVAVALGSMASPTLGIARGLAVDVAGVVAVVVAGTVAAWKYVRKIRAPPSTKPITTTSGHLVWGAADSLVTAFPLAGRTGLAWT